MDDRVFLARAESYEMQTVREAVARCFEAFGGAKALCGGKRVLIKPNLLLAFQPEACATTHPAVVQAVAELLLEAGCRVVIADSAGGVNSLLRMQKLYAATGMDRVAKALPQVELPETLLSQTVKYPEGRDCNAFSIMQPVLEADFIVNIGKIKTHGFTYNTGAVKNLFGCVPGLNKPLMHSVYPDREKFCSMIVDLCQCIRPGFSLLDGITGMQGHGPSGGSPKQANVIIAAENPFAADLAAIRIMGLDAALSPIAQEGIRRGLSPASIDKLRLLGDPIDSLVTRFVPAGKAKKCMHPLTPKPIRKLLDDRFKVFPEIIRETCIGCGDCMRTCPQHTIRIVERKAVIDYADCIRCYCCHELCPRRAIRFKRRLVRKH